MNKKKEEKREYYKDEFIKRYKYLYENSEYILAPFMYEETLDEMKRRNTKYKDLGLDYINEEPLIFLKKVDRNTLLLLEEFLLGEKEMEDSSFYKKVEYLKNSNKHYADVEYGLSLLEKKNQRCLYILQTKLDLWKLLSEVRTFILDQTGDEKNKNLKLEALDEYFRVNRYSNDGKVWTSGFDLTIHDACNCDRLSMVVPLKERKPNREREDVGLTNNGFINFFSNTSLFKNRSNAFHFSELEKQNIYLSLHDDLVEEAKVLRKDFGN